MLHFEYGSDTLTSFAGVNSWSSITTVSAVNTKVENCAPTTDHCSLSGSTPRTNYSWSNVGNYQIDSVRDPAGRTTWYSYSSNGAWLAGIRRPGATSDDVSIGYDANGLVTRIARAGSTWTYARSSGRTTVTDPLGRTRTILSSASTGLVASDSDEQNRTTNYAYDASGRVTQVTLPEGNQTLYGYDARGNLTSTTSVPKAGSGLPNIVTITGYDPACSNVRICNQPNWIRDAKGNQTDFTYDPASGLVTTITMPAATAGGVRPQTRSSYGSVNGVTMLTSTSTCMTQASCAGTADEIRTTIAYDSNLLPTSVVKAAGDGSVSATNAATYDSSGNVATATDPLGAQTRYGYNADREPILAVTADPDGAGPLKNRATRTAYNPDGTEASIEQGTANADGSGYVGIQQTTTTYDGYGRKTAEAISSGGTTYAFTQYVSEACERCRR